MYNEKNTAKATCRKLVGENNNNSNNNKNYNIHGQTWVSNTRGYLRLNRKLIVVRSLIVHLEFSFTSVVIPG